MLVGERAIRKLLLGFASLISATGVDHELRQIQRLIADLGVNLAGVEVIIRMGQKLQELDAEVQRLRAELENYHARMG